MLQTCSNKKDLYVCVHRRSVIRAVIVHIFKLNIDSVLWTGISLKDHRAIMCTIFLFNIYNVDFRFTNSHKTMLVLMAFSQVYTHLILHMAPIVEVYNNSIYCLVLLYFTRVHFKRSCHIRILSKKHSCNNFCSNPHK